MLIFGVFLIMSVVKLGSDLKQPVVDDGLKINEKVVDYVLADIKANVPYCVKIYTPPVIPYTYDYLFLYKNLKSDFTKPTSDFVDDKCWFIIETDQYPERKTKWVDEQVPKNGELLKKNKIKDIDIQLWLRKDV